MWWNSWSLSFCYLAVTSLSRSFLVISLGILAQGVAFWLCAFFILFIIAKNTLNRIVKILQLLIRPHGSLLILSQQQCTQIQHIYVAFQASNSLIFTFSTWWVCRPWSIMFLFTRSMSFLLFVSPPNISASCGTQKTALRNVVLSEHSDKQNTSLNVHYSVLLHHECSPSPWLYAIQA